MSEALQIPTNYAIARRLQLQVEETQLVTAASGSVGRDIRLTPGTAAAWKRMQAAAGHEGITILAVSGFRSIKRQTEIIQSKILRGESIEEVLRTIAAPGYSEHHTGRAIDIGIPDEPPLTERFALTPAFQWLTARGQEFGFELSYPKDNPHGFVFEPWHWLHRVQ